MTRIIQVMASLAVGGSAVEDLAALPAHPTPVPDRPTTPPLTPAYRPVREPAEAVAVGLVLDSGQVAWGDCVDVEWPGSAGRGPVFRAEEGLAVIRQVVAPALEGRKLASFREVAAWIDGQIAGAEVDGPSLSRRDVLTSPASLLRSLREGLEGSLLALPLELSEPGTHAAVRFGVSQALLAAVALARGITLAEVVAGEWDLPLPGEPVPLHARLDAPDRHAETDDWIARRVASLALAPVDDIPTQVGADGSRLVQAVRWLAGRIAALGGPGYHPAIHLDLRGALGAITADQPGRILGHLYALEQAARPFTLRAEDPVLLPNRDGHLALMRRLRGYARTRRMQVQLVAGAWAGSPEGIRACLAKQAADLIRIEMPALGGLHHAVEAVLACRASGVGVLLDGGAAGTDRSARAAAHVALAARPDLLAASPGAGAVVASG